LPRILLLALAFLFACPPATARAADLTVDCAKPLPPIRALHGGNCGPLQGGGLIDLTDFHRQIALPHTRLHDCHWPYPDVVDMHVVFPDPKADPARPESYRFARTDAYLAAIVKTGAKIVYRLGESIEHEKVKLHVHPPADPQRWADACVGIIRHYNDGWAGGFKHDIRYWEIWNEPENQPACWTGTDDDYLRLYEVASTTIKRAYPALKVGGPSLGYSGRLVKGLFEPSPLLLRFLKLCREKSLPLDFFSWHLYTDDPAECLPRARALRALLDQHGFTRTEMHLNEWNYLPDNDWGPVTLKGQGSPRDRFYARMGGPEGAAFAAATLSNFQDAPIDVGNYFMADSGGFGLFNPNGTPHKSFHAFRAFRAMLDTPARVTVAGQDPARLTALAGLAPDGTLNVLVTHYRGDAADLRITVNNLPWKGPTIGEVRLLDAKNDLAKVRDLRFGADAVVVVQPLPAPAVCLITLRAGK